MAARWVGAALYAAAAAAAATGSLAIDGPLEMRQVREVAPLAAVLGGLLGLGVNERWPQRPEAAIATGFLTAFVGLVFFVGFYLFGNAVIEAWFGKSATQAVAEASTRLGQRLPVAAPLTVAALMAAGFAMWCLAALGRRLFPGRGEADKDARAAGENSDPDAAGAA